MTTKTKRLATERFRNLMLTLDWDDEDRFLEVVRRNVPDAWHTLEMDVDVAEPKEKVTLYLDRSVVKAFRATGHGYQARINRLLQTYMQMRIAEFKALERTQMEEVVKAVEEKRADPPEPYSRPKEMYELWAYVQGVQDEAERQEKEKRQKKGEAG
ncbi:MAG: BrnA antitoxin family protein [Pseudomonadota bacterium]